MMLCAQRLHRWDSDDRWAFTSSLELVGVALRAFPEAALGFQLGRADEQSEMLLRLGARAHDSAAGKSFVSVGLSVWMRADCALLQRRGCNGRRCNVSEQRCARNNSSQIPQTLRI